MSRLPLLLVLVIAGCTSGSTTSTSPNPTPSLASQISADCAGWVTWKPVERSATARILLTEQMQEADVTADPDPKLDAWVGDIQLACVDNPEESLASVAAALYREGAAKYTP